MTDVEMPFTHDMPGELAGWYPHPEHATVERRWDGTRWTGEHRFADAAAADVAQPPSYAGAWRLAACALACAALLAIGLVLDPGGNLFLVSMVPFVVAGALIRSSGLKPVAALSGGAAYGFAHGFGYLVVYEKLNPCTGWLCFDGPEFMLIVGAWVAVSGTVAMLVGLVLATLGAWLAQRL